MTSLLGPDDILDALRELARRLDAADVTAGVRVVGGAALAIEYFDRPATRDVDGFLYPADDVKAVAKQIGEERGWPPGWLNDKALMFQSHQDNEADWKTVIKEGEVTI